LKKSKVTSTLMNVFDENARNIKLNNSHQSKSRNANQVEKLFKSTTDNARYQQNSSLALDKKVDNNELLSCKTVDDGKYINTETTKTNSIKNSIKNTQSTDEKKRKYFMQNYGPNAVAETPKFFANNEENQGQKIEVLSMSQILKLIESSKELHAFLPTTDIFNILHNSVEITHRKFFELIFDEHFPKLFLLEKDSNNLIKIDCLLNQFLYLRNLKNILFTDDNKIHFSNNIFNDESI
jgi:hypothetical protein